MERWHSEINIIHKIMRFRLNARIIRDGGAWGGRHAMGLHSEFIEAKR